MRASSSSYFALGGLLLSLGVPFACTFDSGTVPLAPVDDGGTPVDSNLPEAASDAPVTPDPRTGDVQLLGLASLRGQLDPLAETDANGDLQTYAGLEALAGYFAQDRTATPATIALVPGDVIGATPALSALADDVPTIGAHNLLGVVAATFGAHDFERSDALLQARMSGSLFRWVSTNLGNVGSVVGARAATPFVLVDVPHSAIKVAVLGISDASLPGLVRPGALTGVTLNDAVTTTNAAAVAARNAGASVVVAIANFGATDDIFGAPVGPLADYARQVTGVDVVLGGRTDRSVAHTFVSGDAGKAGTLVVQARERGRTYVRVKLHVAAGILTTSTAEIVEPLAVATAHLTDPNGKCGGAAQPACRCLNSVAPATDLPCPTGSSCDATNGRCTQVKMPPDAAATAFLKPYRDGLPAALDAKLGLVAAAFTRDGTTERTAEAPVGDFVADALLDEYTAAGAGIALVNAGALLAGLPSAYAPADTTLHRPAPGYVQSAPYDLVAGDGYGAVDVGAACVVRPLSGQTLWQVLEASVAAAPQASQGFLQIAGLAFSYKVANPAGSRVQVVTLANGHVVPKNDPTLYTVAMTDAVSRGDNGLGVLTEAVPTPSRRLLADVLREYIARTAATGAIAVPTGGRITKIN